MNTKTIQTKINENGSIFFQTNNKELKPFMSFLKDLAMNRTRSNYVKVKGYKKSFGNPAYTFEFWGANTLEEALYKESKENAIRENIEDIKKWESKEDTKRIIYEIWDKKYHFIINEILENSQNL